MSSNAYNDDLYAQLIQGRERTERLFRNFRDEAPLFKKDDPVSFIKSCAWVSLPAFMECFAALQDEDREILNKWSHAMKTNEAALFSDRLEFLEKAALLSRAFSDERLVLINSVIEKRMRHEEALDSPLSFDAVRSSRG